MPEVKEIIVNFRVDEVVPEPNRTKLFFIIHQAMLDGSLDWNNPIKITNHDKPVDPYSRDQAFMGVTKIHNQLSQFLFDVVDRYNLTNDRHEYYLIKLNGAIEHELIKHGSLVYLPQTNQIFKYADDWNSSILLSHEYVFVLTYSQI